MMLNIITLGVCLAILFTQTSPTCSSSSTINRGVARPGMPALDSRESLPPEQRAHFSHLSGSSKDRELQEITAPILKKESPTIQQQK